MSFVELVYARTGAHEMVCCIALAFREWICVLIKGRRLEAQLYKITALYNYISFGYL